jgi:uncharacterized membrane protein YkvA (DUF1232 family)
MIMSDMKENGNGNAEDVAAAPSSTSFGRKQAKKALDEQVRKLQAEDLEDVEEMTAQLKVKIKGIKDLEEGMHWIGTLIGRVKLFFTMLLDKTFSMDTSSKLLMLGAVIYFLVPTDVMPDVIPGIGFIDDAAVLGIVWNLLKEEFGRYEAHAGIDPDNAEFADE